MLYGLIGIYQNIWSQFQKTFYFTNCTTHHSLPLLTKTFKTLHQYIVKNNAGCFKVGQDTKYFIPDVIGLEMHIFQTLKWIELASGTIYVQESSESRSVGESNQTGENIPQYPVVIPEMEEKELSDVIEEEDFEINDLWLVEGKVVILNVALDRE